MTVRRLTTVRARAMVLLLALAACSERLPVAPPEANSALAPNASDASMQAPATLVQNQTTTLKTTIRWSPSWMSMDTTLFTITQGGTAMGVRVGAAYAVATGPFGRRDSTLVTVTPAVVVKVTVAIPQPTLTAAQTSQGSATATDASGKLILGAVLVWTTSHTAVATVSAAGLVTGVATGTATISSASGLVNAGIPVTVTTGSPPPPPPPAPGPNGLTTPPALPKVYLNTPYPVLTGKTIVVAAGGNLQLAINSAQRGDEIVLAAGATFKGHFTLPAKSGTVANGWIVIRSDKLSQLPPEGTRVTSANAALMPKIVTPDYAPALATMAYASGYRISGVELTMDAAFTGLNYGIVYLGDGSLAQNSLAQVPTDLVLDRVYVHGQTTSSTQRCVTLNSARTVVTDSYLVECHDASGDSQAIIGWNGPGPFKIVNNTLQGAAENVMFGGADPAIVGLIPSDIEIGRNYIYTPYTWYSRYTKKNLIELKSARRLLIEGNVIAGSWQQGQVGYAILIKTENQSGRCTWCWTTDVTLRYNIIRRAGAGINISGTEGSSPYPTGGRSSRVRVWSNMMDSIGVAPYVGDNKLIQVAGNAYDIEISNNTLLTPGPIGSFLFFDLYPSATRLAFNNNVTILGKYGVIATGRAEGTAAFAAITGGWQFNNNQLIGPTRSGYPATTKFIGLSSQAAAGTGADVSRVQSLTQGVIIP